MKTKKEKPVDEEMLKKLQRLRAKMLEENRALEALIASLEQKHGRKSAR
jgi:hypothetical protein